MNGLIRWFAHNGIAANLLMIVIIALGIYTLPRLKQEVFPEFSSDVIRVSVTYLGATPSEVEASVCVRVEEAVYGLAGIKKVSSVAREGMGVITVEVLPGVDANKLLDEIKGRVDAIDTFPEETEKPIVEEFTLRRQVVDVVVSGDADVASLRKLAEQVRDELSTFPEISLVELANAPPYEISIEVSEETLQRYNLTFDEVASAVRRSSLDLPAGSVKTKGGEVLLRTEGQAYRGEDFENITLVSRNDGTRISLSEVATIRDAFADTDQSSFFDGKPAVLIQVYRIGDQGALAIADAVQGYIAEAQHRMPEGIRLTRWQDDSESLKSRLNLLLGNGLMGLALVCLILAIFLKFTLAFWVAIGIPISFLGATWLLPSMDISVNLISLFAFIVVLGLVVDDAIVVAENIYRNIQRGGDPLEAAIRGASEVAKPVTIAVLTTIAAFAPLLTIEGNTGKILAVIPAVVIATLIFSAIESLLILPAHLSHMKRHRAGGEEPSVGVWQWATWPWLRLNEAVTGLLHRFVQRIYRRSLDVALSWRYLVVATSLAFLVATLFIVISGRVKMLHFPSVDSDSVVAYVTMPLGTPADITATAVATLESRARELEAQLSSEGHEGVFVHVLASVGGHPFREAQSLRRGQSVNLSGGHFGEVHIELASAEIRTITSTEIGNRWRELVPPIPDALEVSFTSSLFSAGDAINIQLAAERPEHLQGAAQALKSRLRGFEGVVDISDSFRPGKRELKLGIRPEAETLGLSAIDLARQARQGFYGEEAQRIQRGRDDVRVMVRYPIEERRTLDDLETMRIRTPAGDEIPFADVAEVSIGRGFADIQRADRRRIISVLAGVDEDKANANEIIAELEGTAFPTLRAEYPGLSIDLEGEQREQSETRGGMRRGFYIALIIIYGLLAVAFRSYLQPFVVMLAIPFGVIGVIWGHVFMGLDLSMLSVFGLVALTGVVVNDSLIMVDFINRARRGGSSLHDAIRESGAARFRPILLTSLTTFFGLTPLLLERSMQAQFLIPMAASLGFGVLFATVMTLYIVPCVYRVMEDVVVLSRWVFLTKETRERLETASHREPHAAS